jgi:LysR family glycine cleavage system transcriptional activator
MHTADSAGRRVAPFPEIRLKAVRLYDSVYRIGSRADPKVSVLRDWLTDEVQRFISNCRMRDEQ